MTDDHIVDLNKMDDHSPDIRNKVVDAAMVTIAPILRDGVTPDAGVYQYAREAVMDVFQTAYRAGLEEIHKELLAMTYKCSVESIPHKLFYLIAAKLKEQP